MTSPATSTVRPFWPHATKPTTMPKDNAPKPPRKPAVAKDPKKITDPSKLEIVDDPLPEKRSFSAEYKYDEVFEKLKIGQSLKCTTEETQRIANAMRSWIKRDQRKGVAVLSATNYRDPKTGAETGTGRVFLIAKKEEK